MQGDQKNGNPARERIRTKESPLRRKVQNYNNFIIIICLLYLFIYFKGAKLESKSVIEAGCIPKKAVKDLKIEFVSIFKLRNYMSTIHKYFTCGLVYSCNVIRNVLINW